jgi:hypothetical protein
MMRDVAHAPKTSFSSSRKQHDRADMFSRWSYPLQLNYPSSSPSHRRYNLPLQPKSNHPYPPCSVLLSFIFSHSCSVRPLSSQSPAAFISIQPSSILAPTPPALQSTMIIVLSLIQASASPKQLLAMTALLPVRTSRSCSKSSTLLCRSSPLSKT